MIPIDLIIEKILFIALGISGIVFIVLIPSMWYCRRELRLGISSTEQYHEWKSKGKPNYR